ncbi:HTH domain-containing protein [Chitinophaga niabensis]|uniref:HTH domain-containing protein n=1 Tax=Chitinophaga niabensis TaxID=536979 RepID=UPI0031BAE310
MYYEETIRRIERIDYLIRKKGTGNAAKLAERLGVSRASVYEYIDFMRHKGAPIKYSQSRQTFYYDEDGYFATCFVSKGEANKGSLEGPRNIISYLTTFAFMIPALVEDLGLNLLYEL